MGAFAIFASITTFIFVVYFAVMMAKDASGVKKTTKHDVEVISTGGVAIGEKKSDDSADGKPIVVSEAEDGSFAIHDDEGRSSESGTGSSNSQETPFDQPKEKTVEDVRNASDTDLLASTEEAEQEASPIKVTHEGSVTSSYENFANLDELDNSYNFYNPEDDD